MLISLLVAHLTLVAITGLILLVRLVNLAQKKNNPNAVKAFRGSSILLVISGVLLAGIGKLPISSICLESLGLIVSLFLIDFGLIKFGYKETEKVPDKDK